MTLFDLKDKVAIVTGSSRGIGRAIAERLAEHGAKVVISSRKQEACDEVAKVINDRHGAGTAIAHAASISNKAALQGLVDKTMATFGRIDTLVCNAASNPYYGPMVDIGDEQFRKILDNNIVANNWLVAMFQQSFDDHTANITSSTGNQNLHQLSLSVERQNADARSETRHPH